MSPIPHSVSDSEFTAPVAVSPGAGGDVMSIEELTDPSSSSFDLSSNYSLSEAESAFRAAAESFLMAVGSFQEEETDLAAYGNSVAALLAEKDSLSPFIQGSSLNPWPSVDMSHRRLSPGMALWGSAGATDQQPWLNTLWQANNAMFNPWSVETHWSALSASRPEHTLTGLVLRALVAQPERNLDFLDRDLAEQREALIKEGIEIDPESRLQAALFLKENPGIPDPDIGVEEDGKLGLSWTLDPYGMVYAIFLGGRRVRFSVSILAPQEEDREWISGMVLNQDKFAANLKLYRDQWATPQ